MAVTTDALTMAPEDLTGLSDNVPPYAGHPEKRALDEGVIDLNFEDEEGIIRPSEEERTTLRRVAGTVPWVAYTLCAVEFAERASYYGCSNVFSNFVEFPLP